MSSISQVQVKSRGRITLPKQFRDTHNIEDGDLILLADAGDGVIIMQHKKSQVDRIANKITAEFRKEGITVEDMLQEIRRMRRM